MPFDLICLGNLSIDDVVLPDQAVRMNCFGGDTIYAALGARWWNDSVRFVAPVGADYPPENLAALNRYGLETSGLIKRAIPGVHYRVIYANNIQRTWIMLSDGRNFGQLSPTVEDIPVDYLSAKAFLILAMDLAAQEALVNNLNRRGIIALDPQEEYIPSNENRLLNMLKRVDIFLPSQEEVFLLLGHRDYEKACQQFAGYGPKVIVIKMGQEGSLILDVEQEQFHKIPIFETKTVDTTGAGDTYCGGFMAMYTRCGDLVSSGLAGSVAASFAVQDFGLNHMFDIPSSEAWKRLQQLEDRYS
jgi:ribokinase